MVNHLCGGGFTVQQFFDEKVACKLSEHKEVRLDSAGLGKSKESLNTIEMLLCLESAIQLFGAFLRYYVCSEQRQVVPMRDAFALLMAGQKQLSQAGVPASVLVHTKKDKLHNEFVAFLVDESVKFPAVKVASAGKNFVKTIVECLWGIQMGTTTS